MVKKIVIPSVEQFSKTLNKNIKQTNHYCSVKRDRAYTVFKYPGYLAATVLENQKAFEQDSHHSFSVVIGCTSSFDC